MLFFNLQTLYTIVGRLKKSKAFFDGISAMSRTSRLRQKYPFQIKWYFFLIISIEFNKIKKKSRYAKCRESSCTLLSVLKTGPRQIYRSPILFYIKKKYLVCLILTLIVSRLFFTSIET